MLKKIKQKLLLYLFNQFDLFQKKKLVHDTKILAQNFKMVGKNFSVGKDYTILNPQYMEIGDFFYAGERFRIEAWDRYLKNHYTPQIKIGDNVIFNTDIHIGCTNFVSIGDNCLFASRIFITDHHHGEPSSEMLKLAPKDRPLISKGEVIIKNNVWIGEGVAIMPNVTIGENSIIATNSVVTKDIPANCVAAGIPAKIIRYIN